MLIGPTTWSKDTTELEFAQYGDGQLAMVARGKDGQPALKLSVNLSGLDAPRPRGDQVWIKTWAENEGVAEALVRAGIVTLVGQTFPVNNFGSVAVLAELTPAALAELERQR